jgi:high mobility group protein B3
MSSKEKLKFDEMAKADKVRYDGPTKEEKEEGPKCSPKRPLSGFFLILLQNLPQDQIHKPWHLLWRCDKKSG